MADYLKIQEEFWDKVDNPHFHKSLIQLFDHMSGIYLLLKMKKGYSFWLINFM